MPLFVTVTPGTTITSSTTLSAATLNLLGTPTVDITGTVDGGTLTIGANTVDTAAIQNLAVTTGKLADTSVTNAKLATMAANEITTTAKRRATEAPKLIHLLQGDLDWIVMKCLEKDRTRRYDTANGLAADLKRHLTNEPVLARPPSTTYKFLKFARRNKSAFAAASAVPAPYGRPASFCKTA